MYLVERIACEFYAYRLDGVEILDYASKQFSGEIRKDRLRNLHWGGSRRYFRDGIVGVDIGHVTIGFYKENCH